MARDPYYIMVVIYIFFPYFSNHVVGDPTRGQALIGYLNATAGVLLALTAPFLGAIADKIGRRKPWLAVNVLIVGLCAFGLWFVLPGSGTQGIFIAFAILLTASVAFSVSEVFHNAMLPSIAPVNRVGLISGVAFAVGNVAGLLLMLFVLLAFALPGTQTWSFLPEAPLWEIDQTRHEHNRIVGPLAGLWIVLITLPVLAFTPDGRAAPGTMRDHARQGMREVFTTMRQLRHYANIGIYLLARMFFIDGMVGVMTFGGVYASGTFGWETTALLIYGLCTSGSAMIGAYLGGWLDDRLGSLRTLKLTIGMSAFLLLILLSVTPTSVLFLWQLGSQPVWDFPYFASAPELFYFCMNQFFAVFFVTGLSASRTLMARLSPPAMATQFFGLYALSGTVTAFLAPLMVATTTDLFASQRVGFSALLLLMLIGLVMLYAVKEEQSKPYEGPP